MPSAAGGASEGARGFEISAESLGSADFRRDYGLRYAYLAGSMYRGIASRELVIRLGKAGLMGSFGAAGLGLEEIGGAIGDIQSALCRGEAYGMNLICHVDDPALELETVDLFLERGVDKVEASAFMDLTPALVKYHCSGLRRRSDGSVEVGNRIMAKLSRPEVAEVFMRPAPLALVEGLRSRGRITEEQAACSQEVPVSRDLCIEADSAGHTDQGVASVLFPSIASLRRRLWGQYGFKEPIRLGLAGGIGTPEAAAAAFVLGADFILTGSINQCALEAGISASVKDLLQDIDVQDTAYAPAGDMFEVGAKVQVLKKGVFFPARANRLLALYREHDSLEALPQATRRQLEKQVFRRPLAQVWEEVKDYCRRQGREEEVRRAEGNPKHKMARVFRAYLAESMRVALAGDLERRVDFQVHTGPALGAFNQWAKGTPWEQWRQRHVDEIAVRLMEGAAAFLSERMGRLGGGGGEGVSPGPAALASSKAAVG
ncbi:MAG: Polyketide biosynthesis protein PksE [Verrucomicrobia subdivision 3 bacterium]|nr:Polyketide biosynthesis protein PksE [Limisphaerales bacterium]MCS1417595.1 Polyketide biosynthesis protein PksE [Limisphaerales bacterium]UWK15757.1 LasQ [uncultured Verrucomicrobiota bacterium]UWK15778.1 LasQ [uncultured Verrucomicrobiota bacterium]